ncbi:MAG: choice-of-anchor D domain-containing protein, partial [Anaerolineales bacterium]|nr:choice-of-anchor D domain-containing protein [Anaerolineales bacterium]
MRTFTIANSDLVIALNLTGGSPYVVIGGTDAADFSLTLIPSSPIAVSGTTTFEITFDPTTTGIKTATLSIANDDSDENPYNFSIQGTGTTHEMDVLGNGTSIADNDSTPSLDDWTDFGNAEISGDSVTRIFTIANVGSGTLSLTDPDPYVTISGTDAADFSLVIVPSTPIAGPGTTTFSIIFDPTATGIKTAALSIANDDSDENPYNFSIQGTGTDPEIKITGNTVEIADGDSTPSTADFTDFGNGYISGSVVRTFTIDSEGVGALQLTGTSPFVTIDGTDAADFTVTAIPSSIIAQDGSTTFDITFNPSATGIRTATLSIANDDPDEDPYNFSIQGNGVTPLSILSRTPTVNDLDAAPGSNIVVQFSQNVSGASVTENTFNVDGSLSGEIAGAFSGGGTDTITFDPTSDFKAGEIITVTLTQGIISATGSLTLANPATWQFTVDVPQGSANFTASDISGATGNSYGGVMGDVDGDGDLDIYVPNAGGIQNMLWINDGSGGFTASNITGDLGDSRDAAIG